MRLLRAPGIFSIAWAKTCLVPAVSRKLKTSGKRMNFALFFSASMDILIARAILVLCLERPVL